MSNALVSKWTGYVVERPRRAYNSLKAFRHSRQRSEKVQWNFTTWFQLHPSLKLGYNLCIYPVLTIFVLNLIVTIWVAKTRHIGSGLTATLYVGHCATTQSANFWIHILINSLAATLFAASNYMMQRLAAPTRRDVDSNHRQNRSLAIGSLAPSNLMLLGKLRLFAFTILWASSFPIHLMYNSLVVKTSTNAEWSKYVVLVDKDGIPEDNFNVTTRQALSRDYQGFYRDGTRVDVTENFAPLIVVQTPPLVRLSPLECIEKYASGQGADWGDVVVVSSVLKEEEDYEWDTTATLYNPTYSNGVDRWGQCLGAEGFPLPWAWMCSNSGTEDSLCEPDRLLDTGTWTTGNKPVEYCLARKLPPACELNINLSIMIAVQVCVVGKLLAMTMTVLLSREAPLATIGDAITSFLCDRDETTHKVCIAGPGHFLSIWSLDTHKGTHPRERRKRTVFLEIPGAYIWCNIIGIILVSLALGFFAWVYTQTISAYTTSYLSFNFSRMWELGLSEMPVRFTQSLASRIVSYPGCSKDSTSYVQGAIRANSPQLGLSLLYLTTNNLFTRFSMALEFRAFSLRRRGLRVSAPQKGSAQRGTYFLQFPLRYSIPLLAYFTLLHTFLSQALFLRRTLATYPSSFADPPELGKYLVSLIGFSPLASFIFAVMLTLLVAFTLGLGAVRLDWILPSTNGGSQSISALCHPPLVENDEEHDETSERGNSAEPTAKHFSTMKEVCDKQLEVQSNVHLGKVRWGVTSMDLDGGGHCAFSLLPVRPPEVGETYI